VAVPCEATDGALACRLAVTAPGDWRWGAAASSGLATYALTAWASEPAGPCLDDRLEPNDVSGKSGALPTGITSHLKICGTNEDWFHVDLVAWQPLAVYALFLADVGAVRLELQDEAGATVATSTPDEGVAVLEVDAPSAGRYRVRVTAPGVSNIFYDLVVGLP
jgi:hypothetical protein